MFHGEFDHLKARIDNAHPGQFAGLENSLQRAGSPSDPQLRELWLLLERRKAKVRRSACRR